MRLISKLGAGLATLVFLTSGCAEAKSPETGVQDSQPRIMNADYDAETGVAVLEVRRMANVGSLEGPRDSHLVRVSTAGLAEGATVTPVAVADEPGATFALPVLIPGADALYAVRRHSDDWDRLGFRSSQEVVRIDLATRETVVIAEGGPGSLSVADVVIDEAGREQLVLFENRGVDQRGLPTNGRVVLMTVDKGRPVPGSRRDLDYLTAGGLEISIAGFGYIKGVVEHGERRVTPRGFMAFTAEDIRAGRPILTTTLEAAITHVTGCPAETCTAPAAKRAHAAVAELRARPTYDTARLRGVGTTIENVVAAFPDRPAAYFKDDVDPFGDYRLDYDLAGGALVTPRGPQPDPGRVPFTVMGGDTIPFRPARSGYLDLAAYAAGRL